MAEGNAKPVVSSLAALAGVVAAGSCCLPLGTVMASAGLAGASGFLGSLRPWLMGSSLAILGFGFWQTYRRGSCSRSRGAWSTVLLWMSLAIVLAMLLFPQTIAGLLADLG